MTLDEQLASIWELCRALGLPHSPATCSSLRSYWDGTTLHGRDHGGVHHAEVGRLFHEVAHWLCAWPAHRRDPGFGLGWPDAGPKVSRVSERTVSSVGVLLHQRVDVPGASLTVTKLWVSEDPEVLRRELSTVAGRRAVRLLTAVGVSL